MVPDTFFFSDTVSVPRSGSPIRWTVGRGMMNCKEVAERTSFSAGPTMIGSLAKRVMLTRKLLLTAS